MVLGTVFVLCFFAAMAVCVYIVYKTGKADGLRHFAEVIRAFWRRKL
ncbi:hypothetical protein ABT256_14370 [Amycolatopsis japonica]